MGIMYAVMGSPCIGSHPATSRHGRWHTTPGGTGRTQPPSQQRPGSPQIHFLERTEIKMQSCEALIKTGKALREAAAGL